jgi:antibiotic biosynthesis monooxygenase (ABM) superfamily enzyme
MGTSIPVWPKGRVGTTIDSSEAFARLFLSVMMDPTPPAQAVFKNALLVQLEFFWIITGFSFCLRSIRVLALQD